MTLAPSDIFSHLPLDTLDIILRHAGGADLASICRVSKLFRAHALDALYRDLSLTSDRSLKACFSIIDDPSVAARVKYFAVHSNNAGSFYGVIQETLTLLPNLRALELFTGGHGSCEWILPTDPNSCPFQLHTFLTDFQYTPDVGAFVARQRGLQHLKVPWSGGASYFGNLDFLGLPHLAKIAAPFSLVEALVPSRPVREVATFRDRSNIHPDRISCLTKSTAVAGIERLRINLNFLRDIGPDLLARTLPSLSCLVVDCDPREQDLIGWVSSFLTGFPRLHCFNLRLDLHLPRYMMGNPYVPPLSGEQDLQYFTFSVGGRRLGYAGTRVGNAWTRCPADEAAWLLAHSAFN
ncbi:hypothetical protein B0H17DRAFT_365410 [Mycena rosella]|uniref:F-box domain-containing protein n=1 Tax=Mycena rosella TaxID=1033263 RepID=A0AAD7GZE6_MYCRO|nr:hypothetical protein B0H17DRAFT_365410 [Mycena rosella]